MFAPAIAVGDACPSIVRRKGDRMQQEMTADPADTLVAIGRSWGWVLAFGIITLLVGILCLRHIFQTVAALALILGIVWVIVGVMDFFAGVFIKGMPRRGWTIFMGVLGFVAGLVVLMQPAISLVTLAWVLGIWLIVYGTMEIVASFGLRRVVKGAAAT
jgi:uncharacterized membrane protein HdeD (DUF308 family)